MSKWVSVGVHLGNGNGPRFNVSSCKIGGADYRTGDPWFGKRAHSQLRYGCICRRVKVSFMAMRYDLTFSSRRSLFGITRVTVRQHEAHCSVSQGSLYGMTRLRRVMPRNRVMPSSDPERCKILFLLSFDVVFCLDITKHNLLNAIMIHVRHKSRAWNPCHSRRNLVPVARSVQCPLRETGCHGLGPWPRHTKVVKNGTSCSSLGTQTYVV